MRLTFDYEPFLAPVIGLHFLLEEATLNAKLTFQDSSEMAIVANYFKSQRIFILEITSNQIPDIEINGVVQKKIIQKIEFTFLTGVTHQGTFFKILQIIQEFNAYPKNTNSNINIDYVIIPSKWKDSQNSFKIVNMARHPLLNIVGLVQNKITINALIVDLTELWMELHKDNENYTIIYKNLSQSDKVIFKVFGNLSGNAFIWYALIPKHVEVSERLSAHVFFSPSDHGEHQNNPNHKKYLLDNKEYFKNDGETLFKYLLAPVEDLQIPVLKNKINEDLLKTKRNVINFQYSDNTKNTITPLHWNIGAGFEKAFYGLGETKPQQIFLMPQDIGDDGSSTKGLQTFGVQQALKLITDTIFDILLTNTNLIGSNKTQLVIKDKLILSCYSESGFDLWYAIQKNMNNLKAIIAIEPQNLNNRDNTYLLSGVPTGKDVLPQLVNSGNVSIYIIGRHHSLKYKPQNIDLSKIKLLPTNAAAMFQYPPDPSSNDFIKYRIHRIVDPSQDTSYLLKNEEDVLNDLSKKKPSIVGLDSVKKIFGPLSNLDCRCLARDLEGNPTCPCQQTGVSTWYSHNFALTGGQIMQLPTSGSIYNQPITYKTFFQEAVELIG
jgi:hypothetical protein